MQILVSFEPPKIRGEGRRRLRPRSRSGPCPLRPHLYGCKRGRTNSAQREHAIIPAENPLNARPRGRYKRPMFGTPRRRLETNSLRRSDNGRNLALSAEE